MGSPSNGRPAAKRNENCFPCPLASEFRHGICAALTQDELAGLADIVSDCHRDRRQTIFLEGDPAKYYFEVRSGVVRISKNLPDGRCQITGFLYPGDFLGFALDGTYVYSAEAVVKTSLCRFPQDELRSRLTRSPNLKNRLFAIASNELAMAQEQLLLLGRKSAREKAASFLVMLARRTSTDQGAETTLDLPMSRANIGDYLGLSLESVSRAMTHLQRQNLIRLAPSKVTLLDRPHLERLARGVAAN